MSALLVGINLTHIAATTTLNNAPMCWTRDLLKKLAEISSAQSSHIACYSTDPDKAAGSGS